MLFLITMMMMTNDDENDDDEENDDDDDDDDDDTVHWDVTFRAARDHWGGHRRIRRPAVRRC